MNLSLPLYLYLPIRARCYSKRALLCERYYSNTPLSRYYFYSILQIKKLRYKKVKWFAQSHSWPGTWLMSCPPYNAASLLNTEQLRAFPTPFPRSITEQWAKRRKHPYCLLHHGCQGTARPWRLIKKYTGTWALDRGIITMPASLELIRVKEWNTASSWSMVSSSKK